ncbi:MAG: helicase HerA-like domain-containing protein [Alphaproteobacteria bacterium]
MAEGDGIVLGKAGAQPVHLLSRMANRHGLIAGATGTGKTVTLRVIAEQMSRLGVPCFVADVKGDLAGMARPGNAHPKIAERAQTLGLDGFAYRAAPVVFWDVYGERGLPLRATISELGPLLLSRMLGLSDVQEAVLYVAFKVADDNGLLLLDLKDLQALLRFLDEKRDEVEPHYGKISAASLSSIQRGLLVLEQEGAAEFFGEPVVSLADIMRTDSNGRGAVNILAAERLINKPKLYSTVLLWLLSELWEQLPEVGDVDKPKLLFFFDEAHLLFSDAPKPLLEKIEQVTRLIRSKGVGVYYCTQNPLDVPDIVLGQLGNRVQHALRAFTVRDQKAVKAAAETFRINPRLDVEKAIGELGVGEALVSTLDAKGTPTPVERTLIRPPESRLDVIADEERKAAITNSGLSETYGEDVDRESAYELLTGRAGTRAAPAAPPRTPATDDTPPVFSRQPPRPPGRVREPEPERRTPPIFQRESTGIGGMLGGIYGSGSGRPSRREGDGEAMAKSAARADGSQVGRSNNRGILGGILK